MQSDDATTATVTISATNGVYYDASTKEYTIVVKEAVYVTVIPASDAFSN